MSVRSKPNWDVEAPAKPEHNGSELPEGWAVAKLQDIGSWRSGGTPSRTKSEYFGEGIRWVKSGDLPDGPITKTDEQITQLGLDNSAAKLMPPGTICMALYGATIGKLGTMTFEAATNQATANLVPDERLVDGQYVFRYLMSERQNFIDLGQGGAQPNISQEIVRNHPIKLAPLAEQRRIVGKLELLLGKVSSSQQRLSRVPGLLKRFRQSVLAAACSGKLTADWREENEDQIPEQPLSTTVDNFRRACWERDQLERMKAKGTPPKNNKWKAAYETPSFEPMDESPELPEGWDWIRLGLLGHDPLNTVQTGPFGAQLHNDEFTAEGVPVIAVGNLTGMGFKQDGLYFITSQKAEQLSRYDVQAGDVLFARSGATLGKVCVAPNYVRDWRMTGHILRVRLNTEFILPEIVVFALHGDPSVRYQVSGNIRGITRPGFNTSLLESIAVPVAPLSEQQEIVRRVEKLFTFADQIEARLRQAQAHIDRLTQSLLAKAFRGELVPTEHALATRDGRDYQPASALLARLRETSHQAPKTKSKRSVKP